MIEAVPSDYCRQKSAPVGSNLYYSTLYYSPGLKRQLYAWHAFAAELEQIQWHCSDPGVARIKYVWWLEEIQRLQSSTPRHPVTRELGRVSSENPDIMNNLTGMIRHYEARLSQVLPGSRSELNDFLSTGPGEVWTISGKLSGCKSIHTNTLLNEAGCLFEIFSLLQHQPSHQAEDQLQAGHHPVPRDLGQRIKRFRQLITDLEHVTERLTAEESHSRLHVIIMAKLILATCREIERDGYQLDSRRVSLTPLRKLILSRWIKFRLG